MNTENDCDLREFGSGEHNGQWQTEDRVRRFRILYAEDDPALRQLYTGLLQTRCSQVDACGNGREALECFDQSCYDILVTDLRMPVMDGLELARQVRQRNPALPILVITAYGDETELVELLRLQRVFFVEKPLRAQDLMKALDGIVRDLDHDVLMREFVSYREYAESKLEEQVQTIESQISEMIRLGRNRAIERLASNVAHHWRQPLNAMTLSLTVIEDLLDDKDGNPNACAEVREMIECARQNAYAMSDTIALFEEATDRDNRDPEWVSMRQMLERSLHLLAPRLRKLNIRLYLGPMGSGRCQWQVLRSNMIHSIFALVENAMDALEERAVAERIICIDCQHRPGWSGFHVWDSAGGVSSEVLDAMEEPYYTSKFPHQGTGLSLFMIRRHIEQCDGYLYLGNRECSVGDAVLRGLQAELWLPTNRVMGCDGTCSTGNCAEGNPYIG